MQNKLDSFLSKYGLQEIAKKGGLSFISRSLSFLIAYVFFLYLTRYFSKETVGIFQLSNSILIITSLCVSLGFQKSIVRFASELLNKEKYLELIQIMKSFFWRIILISIIFGAIYFFGSEFISTRLFHEPEMNFVFKILGFFLPFYVVYWILIEFYRGTNQFKKSELFKYFALWGLTFLTCFLLHQFYKQTYIPFFAYCISSFLILIFVVPDTIRFLKGIKKKSKERNLPNFQIDFYLRTSYPMILTSLSFILLIRMDIVMLGSFKDVNTGDIGVYGIAVKMGVLANFVNLALQRVAAPKISELFWSKNLEKVKSYVLKIKKINLALTVPLALFIFLFADELLNLFGEDYADGALVTRVVVVAYFINSYFGLAGIFMNMTGNQNEFMYIMLCTIGLNFILNIILIPKYGILGPAISTSICFLLWNLIVTLFIYKKYKVKMYYIPFFS